jgi:cytochrome c556
MSQFANITPFAAAKVTNAVLASKGFDDVTIPPQMMYNYAKNHRILSNYDSRNGGKVYFDGDDFKAWLDRYVAKIESGQTVGRIDYDELAKQYMTSEVQDAEDTTVETV